MEKVFDRDWYDYVILMIGDSFISA